MQDRSGAGGAEQPRSRQPADSGLAGNNPSAGGASGANGGASSDAASPGDDPCADGTPEASSDAGSGTTVRGHGSVQFVLSTKNRVLGLETTLHVPPEPPESGTLFLWPGLQPLPGGANFEPIDNGVLQSVLTWGPSCAPSAPKSPYGSWWISAQYVNTYGSAPGYTGCQGGGAIDVAVGDTLRISMNLTGTTWSQRVVDDRSGAIAAFDLDLRGQAQDRVIFDIESSGAMPVSDVVFTSTVLTFAASEPSACRPSLRGVEDSFASIEVSADGTRCCIPEIVLR